MNDTIVAIATAVIDAGIGIIRISGPEAFSIADSIFESKNGKKRLSEMKSHTIHYGLIKDGNRIVDEVMMLLFRGPKSYTREDCVEIDCHGGIIVMHEVLNLVVQYGARIAEPGEFTKRAFLSGRIDLSQAEAVMSLIHAKNEYAKKASMMQLNGMFSKQIKKIREDILYQVAFIESALDDPEHISLDTYQETVREVIIEMQNALWKLIRTANDGKVLTEGIKTVILGKPNVGKSSLLNVLAREERAIVTEIAGTTRDTLTEHIRFGQVSLSLTDTAGIRSTDDTVEKIGVERAIENAEKADLILYVADISDMLDENDDKIIDFIHDKRGIVLLNKSDLPKKVDSETLRKLTGKDVISISVKEQSGIEELKRKVEEMFLSGEVNYNDEVVITNMRHKTALQEAYDSICLVKKSMEDGMPEDFYTYDFMNAYEKLGYIIGESVGDDLVNEIFAKFCLGK